MCRISGMISNFQDLSYRNTVVKCMCGALQHGGPDDEGIFSDAEAGLTFGHRRLAIIDLSSSGHQPMSDSDQKAWITFNGEIYNYLELKEELLKFGARFNSSSDTEVIIAAYLQWGIAAFAKLRGIFAFALYDKEKALTYLVRDSSGIKPIYYYAEDGQLSFASEVKALKAGGVAAETDPAWQIRFLAYGHIPEPYTTLKNVYSLPKGKFLCWNHRKASYDIHSYHVIFNESTIEDSITAKESIKKALGLAVHRQLIADAPIGVFLSGGIDSSLLTLLAEKERKTKLKTISIYFNEKTYDESRYQNLVLKQIRGEKFSHLVKQNDFEDFLPRIISDMDLPTTDGINTWCISKFAHDDGLKAVLSGLGADELFGGYPSFTRINYIKTARKYPSSLFKIANYSAFDAYRKIAFLTYNHPIADYLFLRGLYSPADISAILDVDITEVEDVLFANRKLPYVLNYDTQDAAWFEINLYMQNQLLRDTDVMGMSHGLEVRVPFLDEDFVRTAQRIKAAIRFDKSRPKKLLIDSFGDILPEAIWNRTKMGFTFPLQDWMKENKEITNESLYKRKRSRNIIKAFKNNSVHWSKAFALFQIQ
ncbi:asparagine synthase (glutamine-hydrolyzing) [Mucilaginibacter sp. BT774]|uniref:asparagine synthase (glutamine-hydrolyzing) n=1 Tax=Mucilaginibacter sp. BT774 TaxID=3062276 RepID=UPI00267576D2|nr:asparagine synthase (glutamine-hydrolyzing) [Mucilaginibacter sp. BT774]MDO3627506.1 asparagine synthase (glutamine-hydrolyzing) [Mucilaginibacter sp. BT774]